MSLATKDWQQGPDLREADDDAVEDGDLKDYKDALLFMIEVRPSMLKTSEETDSSAVKMALQAAYDAITDRIISNPIDATGIMLFGIKNRAEKGYEGCRMLVPIGLPSAASLKNLKTLLEEEFEKEFEPSDAQVSIADALFLANQQFTQRTPRYFSRRIFLITDNDNPHQDTNLRTAAKTRAKDLTHLSIHVEPFFISTKLKSFDTSLFYDDVIDVVPGGDEEIKTKVISDIQMTNSLKSRQSLRRSLFSIEIELYPDIRFGVKCYLLLNQQKAQRSNYVYTKRDKPELVELKTRIIAEETAKELEPAEIQRAYKFGDDFTSFTQEQIAQIRNFGEPIIRIIGFKDAEAALPLWSNIKHPYFLFPSDDQIAGSIRAFSALYQVLKSKGKVAICWGITRRNTGPSIFALMPSPERMREENGTSIQTNPPGFHMITLPFVDDIRQHPPVPQIKAPNELIDAMSAVISRLSMSKGYEAERYPNPGLQWFYKVLQAVALEEELPEKPEDKTLPKFKSINARTSQFIQQWNSSLNKIADFDLKRNRDKGGQDSPSKRQKYNDKAQITDGQLKMQARNKNLKVYTAKELTSWAQNKKIELTDTRKAAVIGAIMDYLKLEK